MATPQPVCQINKNRFALEEGRSGLKNLSYAEKPKRDFVWMDVG
jgi:hypothetical protein